MMHSIFAMELCLPIDPPVLATLRTLVQEHGERVGYHDKWALYRRAAEVLVGNLERVDRGCWDYFDDDARAKRDYDMWVGGMTTEEGVRKEPSGQSDPYRGSPRYMTFTMAFLLLQNSPSDIAMAALCTTRDADLWKRATFARILNGMGALSFSSVKSDVIYVIPRDDDWGLTAEDLSDTKFEYLRPLVT
jgi:hypothetical protein